MQQNQYDYEEDGTYCYPGTNVLRNKLNIRDGDKLSDAERSISLVRMMELEDHPIRGEYDLNHLRMIHRVLFGDIFDWAGELRTVDISKGTMFCKCSTSKAMPPNYSNSSEVRIISWAFRLRTLCPDWHIIFVRSMRYTHSGREMAVRKDCSSNNWLLMQVSILISRG